PYNAPEQCAGSRGSFDICTSYPVNHGEPSFIARMNTPELPFDPTRHSTRKTKSLYSFNVRIHCPPGFALSHRMTPSFTSKPLGSPITCQPSRSFPLKSGTSPSSDESGNVPAAQRMACETRRRWFLSEKISGPCPGWMYATRPLPYMCVQPMTLLLCG